MLEWKNFNIKITDDDYQLDDEGQLETPILKIDCPKCSSKKQNKKIKNLIVNLNIETWFCEHCGFAGDLFMGRQEMEKRAVLTDPWKLNPNIYLDKLNTNLDPVVIKNFNSKKISEETLKHFRIGQTKKYFPEGENEYSCVVYPYFNQGELVNYVYQAAKFKDSEIGGVETFYNIDQINMDATYIVLDEMEVLTFYECGITNVISIFSGNKENHTRSLDSLKTIEETISQIKKIILALPNTEEGNMFKVELLRRIGAEKCWIVQPPEENYNWNKVLTEYSESKFHYLLDTAKPIPVRGIFTIDDVEEQYDKLYYNGLKRGYKTHFPTLDEYYTVVPGQWTVVTGIPGHGKSNVLDNIMVNLAKYEDWRFGIFSPENQPIERQFANISEKYNLAPFDLDKVNRITEEQKEETKIWLRDHFSVILPDEDDSWNIDGILSKAKTLVYRKGIKGLVIDPWNEIDHSRPPGQTETEYISSVLTKIRQFARSMFVHVWLVAHPAKLYKDKDGKYPVPTPYDISGSAHFRNKADNAITVWRNVGYDDQAVADIHIQKIRFKEVGKVGLCSLRFDHNTGSYVDDIDQHKRQAALEKGEVVPVKQLMKLPY